MLERSAELWDQLTEDERQAVLIAAERYHTLDPVRFTEYFLGISPWSRQREIMYAIAEHSRVAVRSGHKLSKSNTAACISLWWARRYPGTRVIITAPTEESIKTIIWRELALLRSRAPRSLGGKFSDNPHSGWKFPDGSEIFGFSSNKPENVAGRSGPNMLFIVDEGSGVDEKLFEAIEGNRAGGAHLLMLSNPTKTSGTFFNAFTLNKHLWHCIHISSEESPNITGEREIPGLATAKWVEEKKAEWGVDSPPYQVRVGGDFPTMAESAVIGMKLAEEAVARGKLHETPFRDEQALLEIGVDVSYFGDDETVITPVRGSRADRSIIMSYVDTVQVANRVLELVRELRRPEEPTPVIKVDVIGYGAGVVDYLNACDEDITVVGVNVAESATVEIPGEPGYHRLRDQLWFTLKKWLVAGGSIPSDEKLYAELLAPHYKFSELGKFKVEGKDEIKKRLKRSPDRADALALAVYRAHSASMDKWLEVDLRGMR